MSESKRDRERDSLINFPNACKNQNLTSPKPGAGNSASVPCECNNTRTRAIYCTLAGNWVRNKTKIPTQGLQDGLWAKHLLNCWAPKPTLSDHSVPWNEGQWEGGVSLKISGACARGFPVDRFVRRCRQEWQKAEDNDEAEEQIESQAEWSSDSLWVVKTNPRKRHCKQAYRAVKTGGPERL